MGLGQTGSYNRKNLRKWVSGWFLDGGRILPPPLTTCPSAPLLPSYWCHCPRSTAHGSARPANAAKKAHPGHCAPELFCRGRIIDYKPGLYEKDGNLTAYNSTYKTRQGDMVCGQLCAAPASLQFDTETVRILPRFIAATRCKQLQKDNEQTF
jgi:hypothetical protein